MSKSLLAAARAEEPISKLEAEIPLFWSAFSEVALIFPRRVLLLAEVCC